MTFASHSTPSVLLRVSLTALVPSPLDQLPDRTYSISLLASAKTGEAVRAQLTLEELISGLRTYEVRDSKDGGAWSPIVWEGDQRDSDGAEGASALAYDLDHVTDAGMVALGQRLSELDWVWVLHGTHTAGRYRLVLPLASDVDPERYGRVWEAVRAILGIEADTACRDLARLFYLPSHPPGEARESDTGGAVLLDPMTVASHHDMGARTSLSYRDTGVIPPDISVANSQPLVSGENGSAPKNPFLKNLDLDALRAAVSNMPRELRLPLLEALNWQLRLPKGQRENPLHQLTSALTTVLPQREMGEAWEVVKTIFGHVIDTMVEPTLSADEYMAKVRYSFERAWDLRENKNAQREAALKFFRPEPGTPEDWRSLLICNLDKEGDPTGVRACTANLDIILEHDENFRAEEGATCIQFNDLRRRVEVTGGALKAPEGSGTTALAFSNWLQRSEYSIHVDRMTCGASILHAAKRHHFNPVEDYLLSLKWDGKKRCARVLLDYCGAMGNEDYIKDVTRKFFISAAARALAPGCKVDTVLVLQGIQGTRKTSFVETLAGQWYTTVGNKIIDKDTQMQATEAWFVELSELASVSKATLHSLRGYLTKRVDQIRVPYAESHEDYPRRCVFVGTTNDDQPLIDPDGNRRYWVVACGEINIRELANQRDQIWAEAVHLFRKYQDEIAARVPEEEMQYRWWLTRSEQDLADVENGVFMQDNPMEDDIKQWLTSPKKKPEHITATQMAKVALHISGEQLATDPGIAVQVGKTLKNMGWERVRKGTDPNRYWAFKVPEVET